VHWVTYPSFSLIQHWERTSTNTLKFNPPRVCDGIYIGRYVSAYHLDSPGTSVISVIGPIPEHCTFQYILWLSSSLLPRHTLTCTFVPLMYISLLLHSVEQSTFFLFLPCPPISNRFARLLAFVSSLLTDSLYGATEMEECVKEAYGPDTPLFGSLGSVSRVSGTKIAVTTMAVSNSQLCILSNYNSRQTRKGISFRLSSVTI
jgi:hypothetical protein